MFMILLLTLIEATGMYNLKRRNFIFGIICYGIVAIILGLSFDYEKIGIVNHGWNIFSSISGFLIGYFVFAEVLTNMEMLGVALSIIGLVILATAQSNKTQATEL
jgi:multidrug transporter EmrE-like cation transporter